MRLHHHQAALLAILKKNIDNPLTIRELQEELGMSSPSVVLHHIQQLEKKGVLKRNPSNPRDYQILSDPDKPISYLNLYGMAQCGPNGKFLDGNPLERIPIALKLLRFPASEAFLVEAEGDSMNPSIKEGDLVIIQKKDDAQIGEYVLCINDGQVLIKKYAKPGSEILLYSDNPLYEPFVACDDFKIIGVIRGILKYN